MDPRDASHFAGKLHYGSIIAPTGFNSPLLCLERLTLSRLIWRTIRRILLFDTLLGSVKFLRNLSSELARSAGNSAPISPASLASKGLTHSFHSLTSSLLVYSSVGSVTGSGKGGSGA